MIWSVIDEAIRPPDSSYFAWFSPNQETHITDFKDRDSYNQDLFGLKTLYELGRVFIYESGLPHDDYRLDENEWYWRETFNPHMDR